MDNYHWRNDYFGSKKFTAAVKFEIRKRYAQGETGTALAKAYGVSHRLIYKIVKGVERGSERRELK